MTRLFRCVTSPPAGLLSPLRTSIPVEPDSAKVSVLVTTVSGMGFRADRASVFDPVTRTDARPAHHLETSFQFLNRVGTHFWAQIRELVQEWLDRLPADSAYKDLRGRLRADNAASWSAFLELYLHEMFRRAGYRVSIHPDIP